MTDPDGTLPAHVSDLLLAARSAEDTARGSSRRDVFRVTRNLLAGCRTAGIPADALAALFHVRIASITTRWSIDGLVPAATFAKHADLDLAVLTAWQHRGLLPAAETDHRNRTSYPASALITALLAASPAVRLPPSESAGRATGEATSGLISAPVLRSIGVPILSGGALPDSGGATEMPCTATFTSYHCQGLSGHGGAHQYQHAGVTAKWGNAADVGADWAAWLDFVSPPE